MPVPLLLTWRLLPCRSLCTAPHTAQLKAAGLASRVLCRYDDEQYRSLWAGGMQRLRIRWKRMVVCDLVPIIVACFRLLLFFFFFPSVVCMCTTFEPSARKTAPCRDSCNLSPCRSRPVGHIRLHTFLLIRPARPCQPPCLPSKESPAHRPKPPGSISCCAFGSYCCAQRFPLQGSPLGPPWVPSISPSSTPQLLCRPGWVR
jgi:hypothetical protein